MPNHIKNLLWLSAYILLTIAMLFTIYNSTLNRSWLECLGDAGVICALCWLILSDGYIKNKMGDIVIVKHNQKFKYLSIAFLVIYLLLHMR
jgi:hypothetical protein